MKTKIEPIPVIAFIKSHPLICLAKLGRVTGINKSVLTKYVSCDRNVRPDHQSTLEKELFQYGYRPSEELYKQVIDEVGVSLVYYTTKNGSKIDIPVV